MTLGEWSGITTAIAALWSQYRAPDDDALRTQHAAIPAGIEVEAAMVAVRQIALRGSRWPPAVGEVVALVLADQRDPAPSAGQVIDLLVTAAGTFGTDRELEALTWLAGASPHAARFAVEHGWRQFCREGLFDPQYGGAVRQRVERSAEAAVGGLERERREGRVLATVSDRIARLERGESAHGGLRPLCLPALAEHPAAVASDETWVAA